MAMDCRNNGQEANGRTRSGEWPEDARGDEYYAAHPDEPDHRTLNGTTNGSASVRSSTTADSPHAHPRKSEKAARRQAVAIDARELLAMKLPQPKFAVPGLIPSGVSILAAKPKQSKSWLALDLCIAVACGGSALGSISVEAGGALFLGLEDTRRRLKSRLEKLLLKQESGEFPDSLTLSDQWPRIDEGGLLALDKWLTEHVATRLVVIDTWARFRPPRHKGEDPYQSDYAFMAQVKAVADTHNVGILVIHHSRKGGADDPLEEVSGTLGLTGAVDAILVLRRGRGQADATLFVTGRDVEESNLALRWDPAYCCWTSHGNADEFQLSRERAETLALFRKAGPMTAKQFAETTGHKLATAKSRLWRMANDGWLRNDQGTYSAPPPE